MSNQPKYTSGKQTHGMRGVVIPGVKRDSDGNPVASGEGTGAQFNLHQAVPMNIVESEATEEGGYREVRVRRLDQAALDILKRANSKKDGRPITYDEAIDTVCPENAVELTSRQEVKFDSVDHSSVMRPVASAPIRRSKTLVKFTGPFGSLRLGYDRVFVDNSVVPVLVLIQEPGDVSYSAPSDLEHHMKVEVAEKTYWCLGSIQYTIPDGPSHTVFVIDPDYDPNAPEEIQDEEDWRSENGSNQM